MLDGGNYISTAFARVARQMEQHLEEIEPFTRWLIKHLEGYAPRRVLEIGVRHGGTAQLWCELATDYVIGIDWGGADSLGEQNTIKLGAAMMSEYGDDSETAEYYFVYGDSHDLKTIDTVHRILQDRKIDLLFIDGDHSPIGVEQDYLAYSRFVRSGGVIAFHDIVSSELTRSAGHGVHDFWQGLSGDKREFCIGGEWGGIGAIIKD